MPAKSEIFDAGSARLAKGINLVEASAGTGKTYAIAMLSLRAVVELGITIDRLLIVTFTKAATEELKARIRARLAEARDLLLGKRSDPDQTMAGWVAGVTDRDLVLARLQLALYDIDQVGIYTIHSFCRKMLQEQALESGQLFDAELLADIEDIRTQVVDDYWRSRIYGLTPRPCSMVMGIFPHPESLLASIRGAGTATVIEPQPEDLQTALSRFDSAFTDLSRWWKIHASGTRPFFEQAVADQKMKKDFCNRFVPWWQELEAFFNEESCDQPADLEYLTKAGLLGALNGQRLRGDRKKEEFLAGLILPEEEVTGYIKAGKLLLLALRCGLAKVLTTEVETRLSRRGTMSFDDLITRLSRALDTGEELQDLVSARYRMALIDEFQDTDAVQWHIFRRLFGRGEHYFYLIGDPKQAIYKFRGADIFSYFEAKKRADYRLGLEKNYRSHPGLVEEVNRLFTGRTDPFYFPQEMLDYQKVLPGLSAEDGFLQQEGIPAETMIYCQLPETDAGVWSSGRAASEIRRIILSKTHRLLDPKRPMMMVTKKEGSRPIRPKDIAILVRSNAQAEDYQLAFSAEGIPVVVASRVSVFETQACLEMFMLLEAIAAPGDMQRLKRAMTISWFGLSGGDLQKIWQDEALFDDWHGRFQVSFRRWREQGFLTMINSLIAEEKVYITLAGGFAAQRNISNIRHLSELIQTAENNENFGIGRTLQWLKARMRAPQTGEDVELRLESDEEAVRIVTMHSAKGLQYPIVFCPYLWYRSTRMQRKKWATSCHDDQQRLVLDLGSDRFEARREKAAAEEFAEDLRIAYVALTRARFCCYVFWADVKGSGLTADSFSSALGYLLFPEGRVDYQTQHKALSRRSTDPFVGYRGPAEKEVQGLSTLGHDAGAEGLAPLMPSSRSLHTDWQMSSYSALASLGDHDEQDHVLPVRDLSDQEPILYPALPAGTGFGNVVHGILEQVPFADLAGGEGLRETFVRQCDRYGVRMEPEYLERLLQTIVTTPLMAGHGQEFALAGLDSSHLIKEMPFYFHPDRIATSEINAILAAEPTVIPLARKVMHGFLTGFVDLFFEQEGRFYILDYKTNYLGDLAQDYSRDNLVRAMAAHNYGLQYWIYSLVLDRYLKNVLPGYRYERHFGGVMYLFVRGMQPAVAGSGVYFALPDRALLDRLNICMEEGHGTGV